MKSLLRRIAATAAAVLVASAIAWNVSPWPSALTSRLLFDRISAAQNAALAPLVPSNITAHRDIAYGAAADEKLDIYLPPTDAGSGEKIPLIVWIHGGAYISGSKSYVGNYASILAGKGFAVAAIDYPLAPRVRYPGPVAAANAALAFLKRNAAAAYNVDTDRIVIAGDSAGANIAAQLAIVIAAPDYAKQLAIEPAVAISNIRGLLLFCGVYKPSLFDENGRISRYRRMVLWSYFDNRTGNLATLPKTFDIVANLPRNLPPVFITAGNADRLLPHSEALAETASRLGIVTDTLFFADAHETRLQHEYQFDLGNAEGKQALDRAVAFLRKYLR